MGWENENTTELYIFPEDEVYEDRRFDFRIAYTKVEMGLLRAICTDIIVQAGAKFYSV